MIYQPAARYQKYVASDGFTFEDFNELLREEVLEGYIEDFRLIYLVSKREAKFLYLLATEPIIPKVREYILRKDGEVFSKWKYKNKPFLDCAEVHLASDIRLYRGIRNPEIRENFIEKIMYELENNEISGKDLGKIAIYLEHIIEDTEFDDRWKEFVREKYHYIEPYNLELHARVLGGEIAIEDLKDNCIQHVLANLGDTEISKSYFQAQVMITELKGGTFTKEKSIFEIKVGEAIELLIEMAKGGKSAKVQDRLNQLIKDEDILKRLSISLVGGEIYGFRTLTRLIDKAGKIIAQYMKVKEYVDRYSDENGKLIEKRIDILVRASRRSKAELKIPELIRDNKRIINGMEEPELLKLKETYTRAIEDYRIEFTDQLFEKNMTKTYKGWVKEFNTTLAKRLEEAGKNVKLK